MAEGLADTGSHYSRSVGLIYVFNLIVGTGALTMPKAFQTAGWLISSIIITALAMMSYLTVTFVVESMAIANALLSEVNRVEHRRPSMNGEDVAVNNDEQRPLLAGMAGVQREVRSRFEIDQRTELGMMATMFFNKVGLVLFNLCIVIYLYGDLAIYAVAVPKSIRDIACTYTAPHTLVNSSGNSSMEVCEADLTDADICWPGSTVTRMTLYRLAVVAFFLLLGGFTFFNVQKTKYLQLVTTASRWIAFAMMVVLALIQLLKHNGQGHPKPAELKGIPDLFGVCVYSFMCHHSLPSLITPIRVKRKLSLLLACDFVLILMFYMLVSFTGIFTFSSKDMQDVYTLNFLADSCGDPPSVTSVKFIEYFLALFPVFTLSTNFPIISITLRNNLKALFYKPDRPFTWSVDRLAFPLMALIPPFAIALGTNQVELLVGITGSYAGAGIQYLVPALLVFCARKQSSSLFQEANVHASPFRGTKWVVFVCIWAAVCVVFVTVNHII